MSVRYIKPVAFLQKKRVDIIQQKERKRGSDLLGEKRKKKKRMLGHIGSNVSSGERQNSQGHLDRKKMGMEE